MFHIFFQYLEIIRDQINLQYLFQFLVINLQYLFQSHPGDPPQHPRDARPRVARELQELLHRDPAAGPHLDELVDRQPTRGVFHARDRGAECGCERGVFALRAKPTNICQYMYQYLERS